MEIAILDSKIEIKTSSLVSNMLGNRLCLPLQQYTLFFKFKTDNSLGKETLGLVSKIKKVEKHFVRISFHEVEPNMLQFVKNLLKILLNVIKDRN